MKRLDEGIEKGCEKKIREKTVKKEGREGKEGKEEMK